MASRDMTQAHPDLRAFFSFVKPAFEKEFPPFEMRPTCVYRDLKEQAEELRAGRSKLKIGKHNRLPSDAIDVGIFRKEDGAYIDELADFDRLLRKALYAWIGLQAERLGFRWGGDWDGDGIPVDVDPDEHLDDVYHVERRVA